MSDLPLSLSPRLNQVRYDIRGPLNRRAYALEAEGIPVLRLNIGNPGLFGFQVAERLREAIAAGLPRSEAYGHQQGLPDAREAIADAHRRAGAASESGNVFIGNGVSELIDMVLRALLDAGDEVLLPAPDYPLWSAATRLNGGVPKYYACSAATAHAPDPDDVEARITPRTRALVLIHPNNPTGAVYPRAVLERLVDIAARHRLLLLADEIYDRILYDGAEAPALAPMAGDVACVAFGGLSKVHLACGYRVGWASLTGPAGRIEPLRQAMDLLASLRLCSNVTAQWAIRPALQEPDAIAALTRPGGRLHAARAAVLDAVGRSRFLEVVPPAGAMYAFPWVRAETCPGFDDAEFALELLEREHVLVVPGSSFNIPERHHFRVTMLPEPPALADAFARIERTLAHMAERNARRVA